MEDQQRPNISTADRVEWSAMINLPIRTSAKTNARGHWSAFASANKSDRAAMRAAWIAAGRPRPPSKPVNINFVRIAPNALDEGDNLPSAMKALRDELVACLGLRGDGVKSGVICTYEQERGGVREYAVRIEMSATRIFR